MNQPTGFGLLSGVVFLPIVGALLVALIPKAQVAAIRYAALIASVATFGLSVVLLHGFSSSTFHFQWVEFVPWIARAGIHYRVGVDGFSIWLVLLTTFLSFISVWFSFYIKDRVKEYMLFMLALETAMLGVFVSLDMIVFYTFFEFSLIPMYFLIAIWGGNRRAYASLKFFLFTFAGSIFMLLGMIVLFVLNWRLTGTPSFSILDIQSAVASGKLWAGSPHLEPWVFWAFAVAFLVKCPAFPFHTWLPDAHVEAPTAGSVILAGVLLKMGTYGFLRFCLPLFPDTLPSQVPILMLLAVIGIIYGAVVAAVQPDLKKLVAYSSVAHMGFVMLGIFSLNHAGILGGSFQQLSHGVSTGALFLLVGLIYERRHTREFKDFGGLKAQMPIFAAIFLIIMLSSAGLPGTNGFVGEFLALLGAAETCFNRLYGLDPAFVVIAGGGVILAAVYLLYMFQQVFYGPNTNPDNKRLKDLKPWEVVMAGSLVVLVFWGGLFPNTFIGPMEASATATRLMATLPAGQRPVWSDPSQEVSAAGNQSQLVSLGDGRLGAGAIIATTDVHVVWQEEHPPEEVVNHLGAR